MKKLFGSIIALGLIAHLYGLFGAAADPVRLQDFQWKKRLIVDCDLRGDKGDEKNAESLLRILQDDEDNLRRLALVEVSPERWVVIFAKADGQEAMKIDEQDRDRFVSLIQCDAGQRVIALIGLDGGVKQIWRDEMPSSEAVYALIDAMPMRLQEMRQD